MKTRKRTQGTFRTCATVLFAEHFVCILFAEHIVCDMEFDCIIKTEMLPIRLHLTPLDDHVGEVERAIRKSRSGCGLM